MQLYSLSFLLQDKSYYFLILFRQILLPLQTLTNVKQFNGRMQIK